ncbi:MAG: ACP S-malonyltransferase [Gammaproteobacteria bacterium]
MTFAAIFPGQGSQSVGMLVTLAERYTEVTDTFTEASDALDQDLWALVAAGPDDALNSTVNTQPVMVTAGVAAWRAWRAAGGTMPGIMAGHSVGEYTALICAQSIDFAEGVTVVRERARLMQEAVPRGEGAIAAILGLSEEQVGAICTEAQQGEVVSAVNFNSPQQTVIAGHVDAVERAMKLASEAGAKRAKLLPMSVPAHSALMRPAADGLSRALAGISVGPPIVPVIHNTDVATFDDPAAIVDTLSRQVCHPVRWTETIARIVGENITTIVEFGPGKVLTGLNKRIDKSVQGICVQDPESLDKALELAGEDAT